MFQGYKLKFMHEEDKYLIFNFDLFLMYASIFFLNSYLLFLFLFIIVPIDEVIEASIDSFM